MAGACSTAPQRNITISGPAEAIPDGAPLTDADLNSFTRFVASGAGKPVVVNVWASWCGPCRVETPLLERAAKSYGADVQFIGVASRDERRPAEQFIDRFGVSYPNLIDTTGEIRRFLGVRGLPTTYVFDRRGRLVGQIVGAASEQTLAAKIDAVLRD